MFLRNLMKLRPESSILLAMAMAMGASVACEPAASNNDGQPTGTTAGTTGGTAAGTTGGTTAGTTTGTTAGTTTGTTAGTTTGTTAGSDAGVDAGPGGTTSGGAWTPPNPSKVKGTGANCLSVGPATGGKCGSYYCMVDEATLTPEIDPSKPCGKNSDGVTDQGVFDYACEASLPKIVTDCAVAHALDDDPKAGTKTCIKADASVSSKKVSDACIDCFGAVADCCKSDTNCFAVCLVAGGTKSCDDAQKAANCVSPLFPCSGLPNPL